MLSPSLCVCVASAIPLSAKRRTSPSVTSNTCRKSTSSTHPPIDDPNTPGTLAGNTRRRCLRKTRPGPWRRSSASATAGNTCRPRPTPQTPNLWPPRLRAWLWGLAARCTLGANEGKSRAPGHHAPCPCYEAALIWLMRSGISQVLGRSTRRLSGLACEAVGRTERCSLLKLHSHRMEAHAHGVPACAAVHVGSLPRLAISHAAAVKPRRP